jgi:hypothetical protein
MKKNIYLKNLSGKKIHHLRHTLQALHERTGKTCVSYYLKYTGEDATLHSASNDTDILPSPQGIKVQMSRHVS